MSDQIFSQPTSPATGSGVQTMYESFMQNFQPKDKMTMMAPGGVDLPAEMPEIHGGMIKPALPGKDDNCAPDLKTGETKEGAERQGDTKQPAAGLKVDSEKQRLNEQALATGTLNTIARADLRHFADTSKEAQAVVRKFLNAEDRKTALKELGPEFNRVIGKADTEFTRVEDKTLPDIVNAKEQYRHANTHYNGEFFDTVAAANILPPDKQAAAKKLLDKIAIQGAEVPPRDELVKTFRGHEPFLSSLERLADAQKGVFKADQELNTAGKPLLQAALEQDRARIAYERAAQSVGDRNLARSIDAERKLLAEQTRDQLAAPKDLDTVVLR